MPTRRDFLRTCAAAPLLLAGTPAPEGTLQTVLGPISSTRLGTTLIHEHLLVDFIGADLIRPDRWQRPEVLRRVLPFLQQARERGVRSLFDCTPAYLGRDAELLRMASEQSGLHILTNTGYYGAVDNKYLPAAAFTATAQQLADHWTREFEKGIDNTGVRPGFIKIGVNPGTLSLLHRKLITAAGLTHLRTGLTICSHTGPATPAFEQLQVLEELGVKPEAFVWIHAQNEPDKSTYLRAARQGAWVSLDGLGWSAPEPYADWLMLLKEQGLLARVLISHDAGWYRPGEPNGGDFVGYTALFERLHPLLRSRGFSEPDLEQLLVTNPADAFTIRVRKY
jgi:phosphotriesterase-related protein